MREKTLQLVISFSSTAHAMAVEKYCMQHDLPGRLIPVPKEITAGCGLAWKAALSDREALIAAFEKENITYDGVYEVLLR